MFYESISEMYPKMMRVLENAPKLRAEEVAAAIVHEMFSSPAQAHVIMSKNWADFLLLYSSWILPHDLSDWLERTLMDLAGRGENKKTQ